LLDARGLGLDSDDACSETDEDRRPVADIRPHVEAEAPGTQESSVETTSRAVTNRLLVGVSYLQDRSDLRVNVSAAGVSSNASAGARILVFLTFEQRCPRGPSTWPGGLVGASRQMNDPFSEFHADHYVRHNQRRLEHLATLGLPLAGRTVLEVGAGIGDLTGFFLDRGCAVLSTEGRPENYELLRTRFDWMETRLLDLDDSDEGFDPRTEIVFCYGVLYHLRRPAEALSFLARACTSLMLLETCVAFGEDERLEIVEESKEDASQATCCSAGMSAPSRRLAETPAWTRCQDGPMPDAPVVSGLVRSEATAYDGSRRATSDHRVDD
jgi:hypothetical protein